MRTTVTLDPDVVKLLKNDAHAKGTSFKVALNEAVRKGIRGKPAPTTRKKPFVVRAFSMGLQPGTDELRLSELADELEVDAHLALTKRLEGKKR